MQFVCKVKSDKIDQIPSAVHVDNTARVQTVEKEFNPDFYNLIKAFKEKTDLPLLLNTSFNVNNWSTSRGKPIVLSPEQAISDFFTSGLDMLIIGEFIVDKNRY